MFTPRLPVSLLSCCAFVLLAACGGSAGDEPADAVPSALGQTAARSAALSVHVAVLPGTGRDGSSDGLIVTVSPPVAASSVDVDSVRVSGPLGAVPGDYELSADGTQLRFLSAYPLYANADYRVVVDGVEARDGERLSLGHAVQVRVPTGRDAGADGIDLGRQRDGQPHRAVQGVNGEGFGCALLHTGDVRCWRTEGDAWLSDAPLPARALQLSAGSHHVCALLEDRSVRCWGDNAAGQLGLFDRQPRGLAGPGRGDPLLPVDLGAHRYAVQVASLGTRSCAVLDNGQVKCWGDKATRTADDVAVQALNVGAGRMARRVRFEAGQACATLEDEVTRCWPAADLPAS